MAECYTKLADLDKNRIDWNIQVRCCRKWQIPEHGNVCASMEIVLVDKDGTRIQATVKGHIMDRFIDIIQEGQLLKIKQFSVVDRPKFFPAADHPYKIIFHKNNYVGPTVSTRFPKTIFNFRHFSDIKNGSFKDEAPMFDIIGNIVDFNDSRMKDDVPIKGSRSVQLLLEDLENIKLQCVLWEPYCHQVQGVIDRLRKRCGGHCVVVIQLCRTKAFRGEIGISNTYHATKVVVDPNLEEIVEFSNKLPINGSTKSYSCSQLSNSSFISVTEELQSTAIIFMTLKELKASEATAKVWVVASISDVHFEKEWCYTSCLKCRKKVTEKDAKCFCDKCGDYVVGNARFKIHVKVVDEKSNAVFLLWDDVARMLVGTSASEICERLVVKSFAKDDESGGSGKDVSRLEFPSEVDSLIGRELLFKVGVESRHLEGRDHVYVVERICDDASIVKMHKSIEHKINDFPTRPYKDIVGDTNWDSNPQDDDIDAEIEYKSPERVLGKRGGEFCDEGTSSQLSTSSKRKVFVKEEKEDDA
ncbi:hypothetical protein OROMI_008555 [Orobanche minor]